MTTKKPDMLLTYNTWKDRPPPDFNTDGVTEEDGVADKYSIVKEGDVRNEVDMEKRSCNDDAWCSSNRASVAYLIGGPMNAPDGDSIGSPG